MFVDIRRGVRYGAGEWDSAGCPQHQPSPLVVYTWSSPAQLYTLHTSVQAAGSSHCCTDTTFYWPVFISTTRQTQGWL